MIKNKNKLKNKRDNVVYINKKDKYKKGYETWQEIKKKDTKIKVGFLKIYLEEKGRPKIK